MFGTDKEVALSKIKQAKDIQNRKKALDGDEVLLPEKWLVRFRDARRISFIRQFYAPGFYEAYDAVMKYAEKLNVEILWFKEKRNCGLEYLSRTFPQLESFCTYCNKKFNDIEPLGCAHANCGSEFCSRQCAQNHQGLRHHPER